MITKFLLFEEKNEFQTATFDNLPLDYQIGLMTYMYEGKPVEWSINDSVDWVNDIGKIKILIADYSKVYGNKKFKFGLYKTQKLINKVIDCLGIDDWKEYHDSYMSTNKVNYTDTIYPVIVNNENDEFIEDGWHRFHYYIHRGYDSIPVIFLN